MTQVDGQSLPSDAITARLRSLVQEMRGALDGIATISCERGEDTGSVEGADVTPSARGAVGVWWIHSSDDILVGVEDAPGWRLPRTQASVATVESILQAVIHGDVSVGRGRGVTTYRVTTHDGTIHEDRHVGFLGWLLTMPWNPRQRWESATPYASQASSSSSAS